MSDPPPARRPPTDAEVARALRRAERGKALDLDEAAALIGARGAGLDELLLVASDVRDRGLSAAGRPGVITYSRKVFIPLTRLCRDRCHYCAFVAAPGDLPAPYLSPDEVLAIARDGAAQECKEALFTLGDRPEARWPQAREWLAEHGYDSTVGYLRAMAVLVLEETGLLPHLNPGVLSWAELLSLKPVAPSLGLMVESTSTRLWAEPGQPHHGSPDKDPAVRLRTLEDAGRLTIPFTTGLLVGIGETPAERVQTLWAIRASDRRHRHVQEVIVQNFRAKPGTAMASAADADPDDLLATVAVARLVLGPDARLQVPPNLSDLDRLPRLLAAGADDWGGVSPLTPDHVNPERPWPHLDALAAATRRAGFTLRERLTVHPSYVRAGEPWVEPRMRAHVRALADEVGLAREGVRPSPRLWQEPDPVWSFGRVDLHTAVDSEGRRAAARSDAGAAFGDWSEVRADAGRLGLDPRPASGVSGRLDGQVAAALRRAERDPASLLDPAHEASALALLSARGPDLRAVAQLADAVRQDVVGETVTYVVNRNINFTNICYTGCRFCAFAQRRTDADAYTLSIDDVVQRAVEAWAVGATEVCLQGGIDPSLPATHHLDLARALKAELPDLHVHAFSPMEVASGAARLGVPVAELVAMLAEAGVDSLPGTAAEILDDEVRWVLTKGKLPTSTWVEVVEAAHAAGLPTSSTMMFGHVDRAEHWLTHLRVLAEVQDRTGGFTEFVPLPFVHRSAPLYLAGVGRPGPTQEETQAVHAAARLLLHGRIDHVQTSWVKLGADGVALMLASGADDLGGTLMEETISRMAGSEHGSAAPVSTLERWAGAVGRPARQRTTTYREVTAERRDAARRHDGVLAAPVPRDLGL